MRIISGNFRNKKLFQPNDNSTRPLKDLVKESIFNIIKSLFESISMVSNMTPFVAVIAPIVLILTIGLFLIKRTKVIS